MCIERFFFKFSPYSPPRCCMSTRKKNSNSYFYFDPTSPYNSSEESKLLDGFQSNSIRLMQNSSIENKLNRMGISDESSHTLQPGLFKRLKNTFTSWFSEPPLEPRTIHINKDGTLSSEGFSGIFSKPKFPMNIIRNQRYSLFTFLPYVCFEQVSLYVMDINYYIVVRNITINKIMYDSVYKVYDF